MLSKRFIFVVLVTLVVLSVFLVYLFGGAGKEPKVDYSWLVSEMTLNETAREKGMRELLPTSRLR